MSLGSETVIGPTAIYVAIITGIFANFGLFWSLWEKYRLRRAEQQRAADMAVIRVMVAEVLGELKINGGLPREARDRPHGTVKEEAIIGVVETQKQTAMIESLAGDVRTFSGRLARVEDWVEREIEHRAAGDLGKSKLLEEVKKALVDEPLAPGAKPPFPEAKPKP